MTSEKVIQSYVLEKWFVSTIRRDSSAAIEPPVHRYCETLIWEWDHETRNMGALIGQTESCSSNLCGIKDHFSVCEQLAREDGWKESGDA